MVVTTADMVLVLRPASSLLLAAAFFFIGIRQDGQKRLLFAILHVTAVSSCFASQALSVRHSPVELVAFLFGWTVHTSGVLLLDEKSLKFRSSSFFGSFKTILFLWTDLRGLHSCYQVARPGKATYEDRLRFGAKRTIWALALILSDRAMTQLFLQPLMLNLGIIPYDFSPIKQGLLPVMEKEDLILRSVMATHWIWKTYSLLTAAHDLLSVLSVSILGWNDLCEWPPLFGSVAEAYELRRFWGSFWHRLHVTPFARYTPSILDHSGVKGSHIAIVMKALRSLWIFLLSAACHGIVNLVAYRDGNFKAEVRFFMCNWAVCLAETILKQAERGWRNQLKVESTAQHRAMSLVRRVCGYAFVFVFFFCTVPAWRYPLMYNAAFQKL